MRMNLKLRGPAVSPKAKVPRSARYAVARRHEQDCWDVLTRHTSTCPPCRLVWMEKKQHGLGCAEGRACRDEWIIAANRKFELSGMAAVTKTPCAN